MIIHFAIFYGLKLRPAGATHFSPVATPRDWDAAPPFLRPEGAD
jgi:hypothetical protein